MGDRVAFSGTSLVTISQTPELGLQLWDATSGNLSGSVSLADFVITDSGNGLGDRLEFDGTNVLISRDSFGEEKGALLFTVPEPSFNIGVLFTAVLLFTRGRRGSPFMHNRRRMPRMLRSGS